MAGFEIGGSGNEYDKYLAAGNKVEKGSTDGGKKPKKLTPKQKEQLREALKKGKLRPTCPNTKYGINLPDSPIHTKYGLNCPPPTVNTKYGINFPPPPPSTKYGINTPPKKK